LEDTAKPAVVAAVAPLMDNLAAAVEVKKNIK